MLPAAMQMHTGESALMAGVQGSGTVSHLAPIHQPGRGLQPMLLWPLNPHFYTCTFSIHCPMSPTDPPVEVLLTDGRHMGQTRPVEQESLIHPFGFIELLHLLLLPTDEKKKKRMTCYPGSNKDNFPTQLLLLLGYGGTVTQTTLSGVTACFALLLVPCCTAGSFQQNKKFSASLWTVSPTTSHHIRE